MAFYQTRPALEGIKDIPLELIEKLADEFFPFDHFNAGQKEAIVTAVDAFVNKNVKHVIIEAPTGVGKSLIGITTHLILKYIVSMVAKKKDAYGQFRTSISTPTKGLQDQYAKETAADISILKGKRNYRCLINPNIYYNSVPCRLACKRKECKANYCPYVQARNIWTDIATLRCTNAAMMVELCSSLATVPEKRADMLILDECHEMPHTLLEHTIMNFDINQIYNLHEWHGLGADIMEKTVEILDITKAYEKGKLYELGGDLVQLFHLMHEDIENYLVFLETVLESDDIDDKQAASMMDVVDTLHNLSDYCLIMADTDAKTFIVNEKEHDEKTGIPTRIEFKPVYPADVSQFGLFRKADYVLHMSATICGVDAYTRSMGIGKDDFVEIQVNNPIPKENRKIFYAPVMKMTNNMGDYEFRQLAKSVDEIIDHNSGANGIIHTVSYDRAMKIKEFSRHKHIMVVPKDRHEVMQALTAAVQTKRPCVIVSPAIEKGYDFKGDLSRFTIIIKTPYEYLGDPLVAYINQKDPTAYFREAVLRIVQMAGRSVRGVDDYADTFILDSSFEMLLAKNNVYFPRWFVEAIYEI